MPSQKRELMYNHDGVGKSYMKASSGVKELFELCKIRGWANAFHRVFENKSALFENKSGFDPCVDAEFDHDSKFCIIKRNESPRIAAIRLLRASKIDANGENIAQCEQGIIKAIHIIFGTQLKPKEDFSEENAFREHDGLAPANALARKFFANGKSGFLWDDAIKIETTNPNQKPMEKTTMKTMYDSHTDGTGVCTPIFMLEDEHLERIIAGKAKQFANIRAKMSDAPKSTDPMIAAMGKSQKWSAEDLQTHTKSRLLEMHPYIAEALVRSKGSLVQASIDAMQLIANRQERVTPPAEVPLIELEEESF